MAASAATWRMGQGIRPREVPAWQGFSRPLGHLEGAWINVDCPNEQYVIEGLRVRRTDARGESEFTIQWNQHRQLWQWGTHGRLSLHWLGVDVIAWVPDMPSGQDPHHARAWRWRRCEPPAPPPPRRVPPEPASSGYRPHRHPRNSGHNAVQPYNSSRPWRGGGSHRAEEAQREQQSPRGHRHGHRHGHRYRHCDYGSSGSQAHGHRRGRQGGADMHPSMRLSCGLTASEVYSLLSRDITPEDYDLLLRLDDTLAKPTASAESVRTLPRVEREEFEGRECGVCLSAFEAKDAVVGLPCRHFFHQECVSKWLSQCRRTCPLCCTEVEGGGGGGGGSSGGGPE
mmetsp:Transcript_16192/g.42788  ORF Transcript_16192/g.42788 Transcript_16192/m.42788 type:complete len:341 (+) Transcript_16192:81-1103(+)